MSLDLLKREVMHICIRLMQMCITFRLAPTTVQYRIYSQVRTVIYALQVNECKMTLNEC